eukprot:CAMPEP_0172489126 /NCGR_PEP_ID=MMETSP1066-20121228/18940_1 /TAXON_ID=671091 /ORGANISM="Coscinodiscus wailesii, Strain CCMP2513" /LENGTH=245 /DNA_ID=CAMNT_0013256767 /DNA_START=50 /DNA_END=787 /DNA_ORIENTATION=+
MGAMTLLALTALLSVATASATTTKVNITTITTEESPLYYIFLQKFPLGLTPFYHTEILVCPQNSFTPSDAQYLNEQISSSTNFIQIEKKWWRARNATCIELGYGGASCSDVCCGVPHTEKQRNYHLNAYQSMISGARVRKKELFLYGTGSFDGDAAYEYACPAGDGEKCWSHWAGSDYNAVKNNCNTFTSTVLSCVYGLSQEKPDLGVSDLVTVKCDCSPDGLARGGRDLPVLEEDGEFLRKVAK